jgi:two-component system, OmpR family, response regulator
MQQNERPAMTQPSTILLVDDDRDCLRMMVHTMGQAGYRVVQAKDGPTGWDAYLSARPELVVTDIGMPGFDGLELTRRIRANDRATLIVVISAMSPTERAAGAALAAGANLYLPKPFGMDDLIEGVCTLLGHDPADRSWPPVQS